MDPTSELISEALTSELISLQEDGGTAAEEAGNSPGPGLGGACVFPEPGSAQQQQQQSSATLSCPKHGAEAVGATVRLRQRAQLLSGRQRVRHLPYGFHRLARVQDFEQTSAAQDEELISGGQRECGDVRARQDCRVEERIAHDACGVSYAVHFVVLLEKGNLP